MKLNKPYTNTQYADLAVYCNKNGLVIEDKGDYLEAVNPPEPTDEEKQTRVRQVRNQYLQDTDKYIALSDFPITDEERELYKAYRVYLRDYPECQDWYKSNPKTYEEWKALLEEATKTQLEVQGEAVADETNVDIAHQS